MIAHWKTELCDKVLNPVPRLASGFDLGSPVFNPDPWFLLRKEVIQPQVPLRLPCYDFIPITIHTFGTYFLAVSTVTSGTNGFHDVTGGVYKAWERIHGAVADAPLLAIPTSRRRVADDDLNWARFLGICSILRSCFPLCRAL
jgi:hypothetical protein